jgi:hypothetical protein
VYIAICRKVQRGWISNDKLKKINERPELKYCSEDNAAMKYAGTQKDGAKKYICSKNDKHILYVNP